MRGGIFYACNLLIRDLINASNACFSCPMREDCSGFILLLNRARYCLASKHCQRLIYFIQPYSRLALFQFTDKPKAKSRSKGKFFLGKLIPFSLFLDESCNYIHRYNLYPNGWCCKRI